MLKHFIGAVAAIALSSAPALAAPNPAASLSVSKSVRASARSHDSSKLAGGGGFVALIAAVVVIVGIVIVASNDDKPASS